MDNAVENPQSSYHCPYCYQYGGKTMNWKLTKKYKGSNYTWDNLFPCYDSLYSYLEAFKPFLEYWKISRINQ